MLRAFCIDESLIKNLGYLLVWHFSLRTTLKKLQRLKTLRYLYIFEILIYVKYGEGLKTVSFTVIWRNDRYHFVIYKLMYAVKLKVNPLIFVS